jgi:hypothetical protein
MHVEVKNVRKSTTSILYYRTIEMARGGHACQTYEIELSVSCSQGTTRKKRQQTYHCLHAAVDERGGHGAHVARVH